MRSILRLTACGWLAAQLAAFAAAPLAMSVTGRESSGAPHACCPGTRPGQMCPMHHTREGVRTCTIDAPCCGPSAALVSMFATIGLPVPAAQLAQPSSAADRFAFAAARPAVLSVLPDPPPPRA